LLNTNFNPSNKSIDKPENIKYPDKEKFSILDNIDTNNMINEDQSPGYISQNIKSETIFNIIKSKFVRKNTSEIKNYNYNINNDGVFSRLIIFKNEKIKTGKKINCNKEEKTKSLKKEIDDKSIFNLNNKDNFILPENLTLENEIKKIKELKTDSPKINSLEKVMDNDSEVIENMSNFLKNTKRIEIILSKDIEWKSDTKNENLIEIPLENHTSNRFQNNKKKENEIRKLDTIIYNESNFYEEKSQESAKDTIELTDFADLKMRKKVAQILVTSDSFDSSADGSEDSVNNRKFII